MTGALDVIARFLLIPLLGWGAAKSRAVGERARLGLGFFLVNVCYPLMILANIWQTDFRLLWAQSALGVVFCAVLTAALFLVGRQYFRRRGFQNPALWNFMLGIGNVAYIGLPVLYQFFGSGAVVLTIVYSTVGDLFIWLLHYPSMLAGQRRSRRMSWLNPCLIALAVSLGLSVAGVPVPRVLHPVFDASTTAVSFIALFYVGLALAGARIRDSLKSAVSWRFSALKVVALPAACFLLLLPLADARQAVVLAVLAGCPTPLMAMVWSRGNPSAQRDAVDCFVVSTLLFLIVVLPSVWLFSALR